MTWTPDRTRHTPAIFVLAVAAGIAAEIYFVFVNREGTFRIQGREAYEIAELGAGGTVAHAFLMRGEGLHAIRFQLTSDRPASATLQWTLWRGFADQPKEMSRAFEGTETFALRRGPQWQAVRFTRDGSSRERWYTIQLRLVQAMPLVASGDTGPAPPPRVSIVATRDNPQRGGVLWINDVRQPGSLVMRADRRGRTVHRRFVEEAVPLFPAPLGNPVVLWGIVALAHWALIVVAYTVVSEPSRPSSSARGGMSSAGFVLVVSLNPLDATTTLFFGERLGLPPGAIRVVQYGRDDIAGALGSASAVVLVRGLFEFADVIRCAHALRIPLYYFVDDNFIVLRERGGVAAALVAQYSAEQVQKTLAGFSGVLLATRALMEYFADHRLHPRLFLFPPVASAAGPSTPARRALLHIAFFGGQHLHRMLLDTIVPAMRRVGRTRPVGFLAAGLPESIAPSAGFSVTPQPYDESYARGLAMLDAFGVDLLVHPSAPGLANNAFKNPHALISAHALGAVPIVSDAPPYDLFRREGVALMCDDSEESWYRALIHAADENVRAGVGGTLASFCEEHFNGARNRDVLAAVLREHTPPGRARSVVRTGVARGYQLATLASRVAARVKNHREIGEIGEKTHREIREIRETTHREVREIGEKTHREVREIGETNHREIKEAGGFVWVERLSGLGDAGIWAVVDGNRDVLERDGKAWLISAEQIFAARAEVASVSVVASGQEGGRVPVGSAAGVPAVHAETARLPLCFLSGRVADLVGLDAPPDGGRRSRGAFQHWIDTATLKGLVHAWVSAPPSQAAAAAHAPEQNVAVVPPGEPTRVVPGALPVASPPTSIALGIDAAWLLGGESGAQIFVFEMLKELARRPEIARIVLISDPGGVPRALAGVPKVDSLSWADALAQGGPVVDIVHRPYQPGADVDYRRYHRAARCVALTVLDFIAYDNPSYHESRWSWRRHQQVFDEHVRLADTVFAISDYIGARLERQFAGQLSAPVRAVRLGTDHLSALSDARQPADLGPAVKAIEAARFLLVLGNDFEHKNRDFAVKVFADMRDRGYDGTLVLAGFHLDAGSSYGHELSGAGRHGDRIVRMGAVSASEKAWLLARADAVLYPTSCEGFGLVPFEAAALATPTAFVGFGPLAETMPKVDACGGWQIRAFADHTFRLIADPERQLAQIRAAAAALTWRAHVDQVLDGYQSLLGDSAPWRTRARRLPGLRVRASRNLDALAHRATNKLRRLAKLRLKSPGKDGSTPLR